MCLHNCFVCFLFIVFPLKSVVRKVPRTETMRRLMTRKRDTCTRRDAIVIIENTQKEMKKNMVELMKAGGSTDQRIDMEKIKCPCGDKKNGKSTGYN